MNKMFILHAIMYVGSIACALKAALPWRVFDHPSPAEANARMMRSGAWAFFGIALAAGGEFLPK